MSGYDIELLFYFNDGSWVEREREMERMHSNQGFFSTLSWYPPYIYEAQEFITSSMLCCISRYNASLFTWIPKFVHLLVFVKYEFFC